MNNAASSPDSMPVLGKDSHYRLIRKIGQGGMSVVYEAFDERLKRSVALKLLHPFLAQAPEYKTRFLREAQAVARLTHPNILQIYDISHTEKLYLVTELLTGPTLKQQADLINFVELPELGAMIICQIAKALEHAHSRGIIHRDIKPENIMITNGQLKLMDFGIASISSDESFTQTGTLLGSLAHVAPEIIKGEAATPQSDIYSLCTVFFWLLSNQLPYKGDSPHALLKSIVDKPANKIQQLSPYVSDSLAQIIERGMHKNPKERYSNANQLALAIEDALLEMGVIFDLNKLTSLLQKPELELESFKHTLLTSIKNQALVYQQNNQHAQALALDCRLESAVGITKTKKSKKNFLLAYIGFGVGFGGIILTIFLVNYKSKPIIINSPKKDNIILLKEFESELVDPVPVTVSEPQNPPAPTPEPPAQAQKAQPTQELIITIWPFANIIIDGVTVARDVKHQKIKLEPGLRRLKFTHPYAATVEKVVNIKSVKEPLELTIVMNKTKPAFLTVKCELDANVAVNGIFKGSSTKSLKRPIVIPMPDKTHSLLSEIIVQRDGFKAVLIPVKFIAGQTREISVNLIPLARDFGDQRL